ncbi:Protein of unknown function [Thermobacillus xylanilyticus]|uniref:Uncharacterized protein n=1 Tax=Thermobacillus xylanilyticus TaxID=76633 RepID=A0ABM8V4X4_THEXY|nr:Protein of unknown function [Thermobacillus xylanilyticus]
MRVFFRRRGSLYDFGLVRDESYHQIRVWMGHIGNPLMDFDQAVQFFPDLPDQALFRRFARLDLAAGELPQSGQRHRRGPLRAQDFVFLIENDGACNVYLFHRVAPDAGK